MNGYPDAPGEWTEQAACKGMLPVFYVNPNNKKVVDQALNICHHKCPVLLECQQYALRTEQEHGVWGGMTPEQRQRNFSVKPKRAKFISCGTASGYATGCRCEPCRKAHVMRVQEWREKKRAAK